MLYAIVARGVAGPFLVFCKDPPHRERYGYKM
jgi:hypothetical protein